jgi:hypothetical protein
MRSLAAILSYASAMPLAELVDQLKRRPAGVNAARTLRGNAVAPHSRPAENCPALLSLRNVFKRAPATGGHQVRVKKMRQTNAG